MNRFENGENLSSKEKYLSRIGHLRHDFLDEIPQSLLRPGDTNYYKYKVRGNYFDQVVSALTAVIHFGVIVDKIMINDINTFIHFATKEKDFSTRTTAEDIQRVNEILDRVVNFLEQ